MTRATNDEASTMGLVFRERALGSFTSCIPQLDDPAFHIHDGFLRFSFLERMGYIPPGVVGTRNVGLGVGAAVIHMFFIITLLGLVTYRVDG